MVSKSVDTFLRYMMNLERTWTSNILSLVEVLEKKNVAEYRENAEPLQTQEHTELMVMTE